MAMRYISRLFMADLLAKMASTVIGTFANVPTFERAGPAINFVVLLHNAAILLIAPVRARYHLLDLSAIAARLNENFAASAEPFVAALLALMLSTRHHISTPLATAPSIFVVSVDAPLTNLLLPTETSLYRSHVRTWRARSSMAHQITRMRTIPGCSRLPASLPT